MASRTYVGEEFLVKFQRREPPGTTSSYRQLRDHRQYSLDDEYLDCEGDKSFFKPGTSLAFANTVSFIIRRNPVHFDSYIIIQKN